MYYNNQIIQVTGENEAKAFPMLPNSSVILLDTSEPLIWVKTTDRAGFPTIIPYSLSPYTPPKPVDMDDVLRRLEKLENEQSNTQSNSKSKRKPEPVTDDTEQS